MAEYKDNRRPGVHCMCDESKIVITGMREVSCKACGLGFPRDERKNIIRSFKKAISRRPRETNPDILNYLPKKKRK